MTIGDDEELFEQTVNGTPEKEEPPAVEPEPKVEAEAPEPEAIVDGSGRKHDPATGKFVPKAKAEAEPGERAQEPEGTEPVQQAKPEPKEDHRIPLSEHLSEREKRQAAERRAEDLAREMQALNRRVEELSRPKPEPQPVPDMYADPNGFVQHGIRQAVTPIEQRMEAMRDQFSEMLAVQQYGQDAVTAAKAALEAEVAANPAMRFEVQKMWQAPMPYGEVVKWHKRQTVLKEVGEDPTAYRQRIIDEALKDPEVIQRVIAQARTEAAPQPGNRAPPNVKLPPSLNRTTGAPAPVDAVARTDAELFEALVPQ